MSKLKCIKIKRRSEKRLAGKSGRALAAVKAGQFFDGEVLTAKQLNRLVFAIRDLARKAEGRR